MASDANFAPWLGVALSSILRFNNGPDVTVHILCDNILKTDLEKLRLLAEERNVVLVEYDISGALSNEGTSLHTRPVPSNRPPRLRLLSKHLSVGHKVSRSAYSRLFIDRLLDPTIERVIYIDSDVLCRESLKDLSKIDIGDAIVGAVAELPEAASFNGNKLNLPTPEQYFNSGMLVIDLQRWREADVGANCLEWLSKNQEATLWWDQDALNATLFGHVYFLNRKWNYINFQHAPETPPGTAIWHAAGPHKPWLDTAIGPAADEWRRFYHTTHWKDTPSIKDPNKIRQIRKNLIAITPFGNKIYELLRGNPRSAWNKDNSL
ncbi:glycosyltransferase family 8 protein [Acidocella aromatica]|uniref:UDP-glucose:(Glucosyl)LPS alpha-1, 3-glucosyltransferase/UDP-D-galactose:(Glucosyl)LPS alpha-1,3-D-galactosyltransferase n=1 Tax=Acidocella aromatica TaxID=1303579 RepID=A0A840VNQ5_9PROT|nr:glycosyltransferase family 8 protein [Acidocella aromatica]MBB5373789.1 UDP-glucose:(glucosyl)LPS alpha-1,3-glucosyltransferase/UDP-D-galactose:(glucosyl)LPS alpha-1,3-D-galactosyltransferase [Acidocella aromatica]